MKRASAYHPAMMVKLLFYGYCVGVRASRRIEQKTNEDVAFRVLSCDTHPDHSRISDFGKRHLADAGYFTEESLGFLTNNFIEPFIPRDPMKHSDPVAPAPRGRIPDNMSVVDRMLRKLKTKAGKEIYAKRKESVEAVFGQIKDAGGMRAFLLRGLEKAKAEWNLICLTHNILKLWRRLWGEPSRIAARSC